MMYVDVRCSETSVNFCQNTRLHISENSIPLITPVRKSLAESDRIPRHSGRGDEEETFLPLSEIEP
jgi:hypothetical protein